MFFPVVLFDNALWPYEFFQMRLSQIRIPKNNFPKKVKVSSAGLGLVSVANSKKIGKMCLGKIIPTPNINKN